MGGGALWLPRSETQVGRLLGAGEACGKYRVLDSGLDRVKREAELAEFVA